MEEMSKHGRIGLAAMRAGMDRKTARKYVRARKLPSELVEPRLWRTREDPFDRDWAEVTKRLEDTPELEAKTLFDWLCEQHPGRYEPGQLRTLQRRVRRWRAQHGAPRDVVFAQAHRAGEAAQTDFTEAGSLGVTIERQPFAHLLCVVVLPYSNWQWATVCQSESMAALRRGVQAALFQLGRVPRFHQTDNSTAATHRIPGGKGASFEGGKRPFNDEYVALMRHLGMTPRTTEVGAKEQNGDVEASNGALKRRLAQALLMRGTSDFASVEQWQDFVHDVLRKANAGRGERVAEDLAAMRPLVVERLPEHIELRARVSDWSTIRVRHCSYSVPSRLIGHTVLVRLFEQRLEVVFAGDLVLACDRLQGRMRHRVDYRHIIWSLVRKPGAFARYVYREELFPSLVFRRAYDAIQAERGGLSGDIEYLRILHLAASTVESDVEAALTLLLDAQLAIDADAAKAIVCARAPVELPELAQPVVDLGDYDALLREVGT